MTELNLTVEAEGHITHADGTTEPITVTNTHGFGMKFEADGDVQHANPHLWHGNQLKEQ